MAVCVCVRAAGHLHNTSRTLGESAHAETSALQKNNWVPALGVAPHADTRKCMQQGGCTIPLSTCGSRCATQRVQRSCRLYQQHARQSAISEKTRIAAGNGGLRGGCLVVGLTVNNREGKATVHNTQRCLPQSSVMFNCSGCYPSCGLQICGVAPETFSLSMRSCPSSSQLIVSTNLSHVSSGNHCRSDPVQVQSTSRIVGTAGTTADKTNINVVLPIGPLLGTTWAHACCRLLWVLAPYVGISAGGVWRLWAWVTSDHSKPSSWLPQVRLTAGQLQLQAVTNTHPAILHYRNPMHNLRKHDETHHAMEDCGVGGWLSVRMIREVTQPQSLHPSPPRDQQRVGAQQPIHRMQMLAAAHKHTTT